MNKMAVSKCKRFFSTVIAGVLILGLTFQLPMLAKKAEAKTSICKKNQLFI